MLRITNGNNSSKGTPSQRKILWMSAKGRVTRSINANPQVNGARPNSNRCISSPSGPQPIACNAASHRTWVYSIIQATSAQPRRRNTSANRILEWRPRLFARSVSAPTKKAAPLRERLFEIKSWQCPTLTWGDPTLPSALSVFTSEFEMGSGGSRSLLPPGKLVGNDLQERLQPRIRGLSPSHVDRYRIK
jgi:hypothetical protein